MSERAKEALKYRLASWGTLAKPSEDEKAWRLFLAAPDFDSYQGPIPDLVFGYFHPMYHEFFAIVGDGPAASLLSFCVKIFRAEIESFKSPALTMQYELRGAKVETTRKDIAAQCGVKEDMFPRASWILDGYTVATRTESNKLEFRKRKGELIPVDTTRSYTRLVKIARNPERGFVRFWVDKFHPDGNKLCFFIRMPLLHAAMREHWLKQGIPQKARGTNIDLTAEPPPYEYDEQLSAADVEDVDYSPEVQGSSPVIQVRGTSSESRGSLAGNADDPDLKYSGGLGRDSGEGQDQNDPYKESEIEKLENNSNTPGPIPAGESAVAAAVSVLVSLGTGCDPDVLHKALSNPNPQMRKTPCVVGVDQTVFLEHYETKAYADLHAEAWPYWDQAKPEHWQEGGRGHGKGTPGGTLRWIIEGNKPLPLAFCRMKKRKAKSIEAQRPAPAPYWMPSEQDQEDSEKRQKALDEYWASLSGDEKRAVIEETCASNSLFRESFDKALLKSQAEDPDALQIFEAMSLPTRAIIHTVLDAKMNG